jgi:hypothetical protein
MILTHRMARAKLGERLTVWVNPQKVRLDVGTKWPVTIHLKERVRGMRNVPVLSRSLMRVIEYCDPFVIPPAFYREARSVEGLEKFEKVRDFLDNRMNMHQTLWHRALSKELRDNGVAYHKGIRMDTPRDIDSFFEGYVMPMVHSLAAEGFQMDRGGGVGAVLVGPNGELHKAGSGNHRFYVARVLGLPRFPFHVAGVHQTWFAERVDAVGGSRMKALGASLTQVESMHQ